MPRPLKFSRTRYLRHWTIHRAWQLFRSNVKASRRAALHRMYQGMFEACEELRTGVGDGGRLFRKAMMKTGLWSIPERGGGVPIEYARGLVEWVREADVEGSGKGEGEEVEGAGRSGRGARIWESGWKAR